MLKQIIVFFTNNRLFEVFLLFLSFLLGFIISRYRDSKQIKINNRAYIMIRTITICPKDIDKVLVKGSRIIETPGLEERLKTDKSIKFISLKNLGPSIMIGSSITFNLENNGKIEEYSYSLLTVENNETVYIPLINLKAKRKKLEVKYKTVAKENLLYKIELKGDKLIESYYKKYIRKYLRLLKKEIDDCTWIYV